MYRNIYYLVLPEKIFSRSVVVLKIVKKRKEEKKSRTNCTTRYIPERNPLKKLYKINSQINNNSKGNDINNFKKNKNKHTSFLNNEFNSNLRKVEFNLTNIPSSFLTFF